MFQLCVAPCLYELIEGGRALTSCPLAVSYPFRVHLGQEVQGGP